MSCWNLIWSNFVVWNNWFVSRIAEDVPFLRRRRRWVNERPVFIAWSPVDCFVSAVILCIYSLYWVGLSLRSCLWIVWHSSSTPVCISPWEFQSKNVNWWKSLVNPTSIINVEFPRSFLLWCRKKKQTNSLRSTGFVFVILSLFWSKINRSQLRFI